MRRTIFIAALLTASCVDDGNPGAFKATARNQCAYSTGAFLAGTTAEATVDEGGGFVTQKSRSWGDENGYASQSYAVADCSSNKVLEIYQASETLVEPKEEQPDWAALDRFVAEARAKGLIDELDDLNRSARKAGLQTTVNEAIPAYEQGLQCACQLALKNLPTAGE